MRARGAVVLGAVLATGLVAAVAQDRPFPGSELPETEILHRIETGTPTRFRPVGTTSVVFKMTIEGGPDASFRPRVRTHARGHLGEIAAYRLGRLLGLDTVPPAVTRVVSRNELRGRLSPDYVDAWDGFDAACSWDENGTVVGASVFWVEGLRDVGIDGPGGINRWTGWLKIDGELPDAQRVLARDVSNMVAFDYLIANRDRWSGGNARGDASGTRVIVRDHNLAFAQPLPREQHRRMLEKLSRVERYSRRFVARLAALDEPSLRAELARDPHASRALALDDAQLRALFDRRDTILSRVGALVAQHGAEKVLVFE